MSRHRAGRGLVIVLLVGCGMPLGPEVRMRPASPRSADAIVVLGNRPPRGPDGAIAPESERRVRRGVELFHRGLAPRLVLAGGPAPGGGTESAVMAAYAHSLGVPATAMLEERESRDTAENARNTVALLCAEHGEECRPELLVVTSPYHLRRAVRLFECAGARVTGVETEMPGDVGYQAGFTAYEYLAGMLGLFADACGRAAEPPSSDRRLP